MLTYILYFVLAMMLTWSGIYVFQSIFRYYGILDNPLKYWKKRDPIPYSMGIVFFLVFFVITYFFIESNYKLQLIWVFWFLVTSISFIDDMLNVSPKVRLMIQIAIGAIIGITSIKIGYVSSVFWGVIDLETHYIMAGDLKIYTVPLLFTIAWYVFVFNALNWSDGIEWNTSGLALISFFIIFLLGLKLFYTDEGSALKDNAEFIMQMSIVLVGILIPFWYYDFHEKILMWDSWTMFLGFMLATIAIIAGWKIATVLVVFWVYFVDALYVVSRRVANGKNPLKWDFTHIHHRLMDIGVPKKQVLLMMYGLSFIAGITALFLDKSGKITVFVIIAISVVFLSYFGEQVKKITFKK